MSGYHIIFFFLSSRRRHTRSTRHWSSDVCSSDLATRAGSRAWTRGMILFRARDRRLLVVMDQGGTAEVVWDEAAALQLRGLVAVYDVDGGGDAGIVRPLGFETELPAAAPERTAPVAGAPSRFAVALAPASEPWRPGPVLHRVTYTWAGTLPYDTYEWPDHVPCTLTDAIARCRARVERGRQQAAVRMADRAGRRRTEAWGESVLL